MSIPCLSISAPAIGRPAASADDPDLVGVDLSPRPTALAGDFFFLDV